MNHNIHPHALSNNEISELARTSQETANQKRDEALSTEHMRTAKRVAALVLATIAIPAGFKAVDRMIEQPQQQSTHNAQEFIQNNPDSSLARQAK